MGLFAFALAWAVFMFGSVTGGPRVIAGILAGMTGLVTLCLLEKERKMPPVPIILWVCIFVLVVFGWYMTINARADHSMALWIFVPVEGRPLNFDWAPGSVALSSSLRVVIEVTLVLIALVAAVRTAESGAWRAVLKTIAIFGALVALTGFLHKALGARTVWWIDDELSRAGFFFAPFVYHANAGAFLNLCLPIAIGLSLSEGDSKKGRSWAMVWMLISVLLIAAVFATASKGAMAILVVLLPFIFVLNFKRMAVVVGGFFLDRRRRVERMAFVVILWMTGIVFVALGIESSLDRLDEFMSRFDDDQRESLNGRVPMMQLMLRMIRPDEGSWHGFGPGSFPHLVPYFTATQETGEKAVLSGRWLHGHSDPLQTIVEWGYLGAAAWFLIGVGAVFCAIYLLKGSKVSRQDLPLVRGMIVALVMVGLHSCVDFPLSLLSIQLVALLMCGICWGLFGVYRRERKKEKALAGE